MKIEITDEEAKTFDKAYDAIQDYIGNLEDAGAFDEDVLIEAGSQELQNFYENKHFRSLLSKIEAIAHKSNK